jgi:amidase
MFAKHKNEYGPKLRELIENGLTIPATEYAKALQTRLQQSVDVEPVLHRVDALLTPGITSAAPRGLGSTGNAAMQAPWSIIGVPSISLPTGLNKDGLPLAIQLVGPPKAEDRLLAVARWCEKALNVHLRPPLDQDSGS